MSISGHGAAGIRTSGARTFPTKNGCGRVAEGNLRRADAGIHAGLDRDQKPGPLPG